MKRSMLTAAAMLFAGAAQAQSGEWKGYVELVSGKFDQCPNGGTAVIREIGGKFTMYSPDGKREQWSVKLAADGSARSEAYSQFTQSTLAISIPSGTGPRAFDAVNKTRNCTYKVKPAA